MTPVAKPTTEAEKRYNESQIATVNIVSRCFEAWKRRFPVLSYGMRIHVDTAKVVIVACAVLHNIAIQEKDPLPPKDEDSSPESFGDDEEIDDIVDASDGFHRNDFIIKYFDR
ncbi:hypothetical protein M5D96_009418 [Drosophila gunungcola]|uniref:DDE Tnp4 domain-containing protein n=3 Tax=Drosophila gunungcola TaxID=103775 RepID=A0A9P9YJ80_9MUSC|nr:hypothetical protein M5D96_009418 [Drosophila gunungcola]